MLTTEGVTPRATPQVADLTWEVLYMAIEVKYLAGLRDEVGRSGDSLPFSECLTAAEVWEKANPDRALPVGVLVAVNKVYAQLDTAISDGDEIAFFPPVTGG